MDQGETSITPTSNIIMTRPKPKRHKKDHKKSPKLESSWTRQNTEFLD